MDAYVLLTTQITLHHLDGNVSQLILLRAAPAIASNEPDPQIRDNQSRTLQVNYYAVQVSSVCMRY